MRAGMAEGWRGRKPASAWRADLHAPGGPARAGSTVVGAITERPRRLAGAFAFARQGTGKGGAGGLGAGGVALSGQGIGASLEPLRPRRRGPAPPQAPLLLIGGSGFHERR